MSYIITKTINDRFTYYWNRESKKWEGLRNNASTFKTNDEVNEAVRTIRRLNLYDKSVYCKLLKGEIK